MATAMKTNNNSNETLTPVRKLQTFTRAIDHFRTIDPEFPPQMMAILLAVATTPNSTMSSLSSKTGISLASVSKFAERLGSRWSRNPAESLGLIESVENPEDRREKLVNLTQKGRRFVDTLLQLLEH